MPKRLQWNASAARFRDPDTGRYISRDQVRAWLDRLIDASQRRVQQASVRLRLRQIDVSEWEEIMRQEIKRTHLGASALLRGGWGQLDASDYGRIGQSVREQYKYLDRFAQELRRGDIKSDGTFFNRAKLYPASARVMFHDEQGDLLEALGYEEERNVLHPAEHCQECLDQSAAGWVPIGTLIPVGSRLCRGNDRCSMRYR